jgi:hypothetical protein
MAATLKARSPVVERRKLVIDAVINLPENLVLWHIELMADVMKN